MKNAYANLQHWPSIMTVPITFNRAELFGQIGFMCVLQRQHETLRLQTG